MRHSTIVLAGVLALATIVSLLAAAAAARAEDDPWQAVKAATARFHSLEQAEKAGYVRVSACVASPAGAMGFHYENAALMADDTLDPQRPEVLLYAPKADGGVQLVGVEYWRRDADGSLATDDDRPSLFGVPFQGPMAGHSPAMPPHYDLHAWLFADNPNGTFAQFNPAVSCTP